jgi:large subunit ribosomal protein L29
MSKRKEELDRIRDLPEHELSQALLRAQDELFRRQLAHYTNQVEDTMSIRGKRREVARIQTVIRGRAIGLEKQQAAAGGKDE